MFIVNRLRMLDLVIVGAAAAGCSAAVYASRRNLNFKIIAKDIGGEVALSGEVENWPGTIHTTGIQLAEDFHAHVKNYGVEIEDGWEVTAIRQVKNYHEVVAKKFTGEEIIFKTKTVILATGIHPRMLNIPGEAAFKGKGVTYCTVCDGPLFKGKVTATIGAGNSALESALMLSEIAEKAYLITKFADTPETKGGFPKGENILIDKVKSLPNVEIIYNANTCEITGEGLVKKICYTKQDTQENVYLDVNGVMVHIGMIPNSGFVDCVEKNENGELNISILCETSCKGIFAAGDVTNVPHKQIAIAAGQGVTAALSAIDYINKWREQE
ncbi:MAG: pyridine nucleotide-disulfide oxidoreductase [Candidatus Magasanikbacteria bacterium CG11_big_fil_rev_8_21_14_0_20_39_34]|uniref:Pyridine nucleotide-disulfide oxidoreductase n=1 Tax=Candidatus Magasanikbacteria bacterium CG11_big_fil_rev_8_21_14_0_20_39_34 TaxID=1974653 RepID=A0A2H0N4A9_9BACT|nr:MAG: pyridine nucleotide-disulfide oxidoreductase [Candidatus Magasanikbacteria bacterium CG11_big_fil_rev_8_21_14_0_20_39_34]